MVYWPAQDGYDYFFQVDYNKRINWIIECLTELCDYCPDQRFAIEYKQFEPRTHIFLGRAGEVMTIVNEINRKNLGVNIDIGHALIVKENISESLALIQRYGKLFHTHWNSQPMGNYDQDLNVGVVEWQQAEASLFALKMAGYNEYFGIDINPERMPVEKAIEINSTALNIMNEKINSLPNEEIMEAYFDPENHRGDIELILTERMK